ncbi:asparagine synthase-related protein [Halorussus salilacus]|uniref:asparagine synthase C-terminal domain-containing protein n=1 Tax=Halorussus salilacus TaxID=2953750 RepID=UPI00209E7B4E|nr:asparagine synthase-related protein [Halorussus salilacus]USZ69632.1 asparagine synthase-related protein [Halorussus salilacus]
MRGASADRVAGALADRDPLPGADSGARAGIRGFAGELPDGRLVRDVLGRQPLFVEGGESGGSDWSFSPADLADPEPLPAGCVRSESGVERVFSLPEPSPTREGVPDRDRAVAVRDALAGSLDSVAEAEVESEAEDADEGDLAVAFSGGVDSTVVASAIDAPLYVVGFPDSHDVSAARRAARLMGREDDLRVVELDASDLERAVPEVARATGRTNAMDVQIALPLFLAGQRAARDGHDRLAVGQGADELFGGYAKVARAPEDPRVEADTVRGATREVIRTLPAQLERDVLALRAAGVEPVAPLLDDRVVRAALGLPGDLLVDSRGERKKALRLAAREFVPDSVAFREKKAVQYGSLVARELDRLARRAGFKRRMDDHVSKYVESRVGG